MLCNRPRFGSIVFCLLIACLALTTEPSLAQPITTDAAVVRPPQRNGYFADLDITKISRVEWSFKSERGVTGPTVANGMVFFADDDHVIHAKSARGGLSVWKKPIQQRVYRPLVADSRHVYAATEFGVLVLSSDGGEPGWHFPITGGTGEIVLWRPTNTLFVGGSDGWLRAINSLTGKEKWKASLADDVPDDPEGFDGKEARLGNNPCRPSGIATDGSTVFQNIFDQSRVIACDVKTGKIRWTYQTKGWIGGTPSLDDQYCYVGSQDRHMYALDKMTGKPIWKFKTGSRVSEGPALHKQFVVFGSCDGGVYCVNRTNGELIWQVATDPDKTGRRFIYSKPIINDDAVCIATGEGQVYGIELQSGTILWKNRPSPISQCYCSPVTDGVRVFVCTRPDWDDNGEAGIFALGPEANKSRN